MQKWKHPVDIIKILQQNLLNIATEPTFWKCFMKTVLSRGYSETLYFNSSYWSNCCASFQEQCIAFFMKNIVAIIFFLNYNLPRPRFYYSICKVLQYGSDHVVGRPRAEIRTRYGRLCRYLPQGSAGVPSSPKTPPPGQSRSARRCPPSRSAETTVKMSSLPRLRFTESQNTKYFPIRWDLKTVINNL